MTVELTREDLKPYTSLLLGKLRPETIAEAIVDDILAELREALGLNDPGSTRRVFVEQHGPELDGELEAAFLRYREARPPSWLVPFHDGVPAELLDLYNQLVVVCRLERHLALFASEPAAKQQIERRISGSTLGQGLSGLEPILPGVLNASFVRKAEPVRTLWLSGIHRRTAVKADSKILAGLDLENALEPLGDQTYYFTAARARTELALTPDGPEGLTVGVTPRRSRVWIGPVQDWPGFRNRVAAVLTLLRATEKAGASTDAPLSVLAAPVSSVSDIDRAYDVSVIAPEILADDPDVDPQLLQVAERWAYDANFEVVPRRGPNLGAKVSVGGMPIGQIEFLIQVDARGKATVNTNIKTTAGANSDLVNEALAVCSDSRWLTIRYESGHTLSDGIIYTVRHRDVRFEGWNFVDLKDFNLSQEKPTITKKSKGKGGKVKRIKVFAPQKIGQQKSLFCWVQQNWPPDVKGQRGYLACDDGAGEIADFIHFDPAPPAGRPSVTLIHVKASHDKSASRGISTSDYEVVVGQAVKNLRSLDRINLADGLESGKGKAVAAAVWHNGSLIDRDTMAAALRRVGDNYRRRIVVLQPRVTQSALNQARADQAGAKKTGRVARIRQLDTLLVAAAADCRALMADFVVYGQAL